MEKIQNTNMTPKMTKYERAIANLGKLCFSKNGPAVNFQHIEAQMEKIKTMNFKGVR